MPKDKQAFIYGRNPVLELLREGTPVERLIVQKGISSETMGELRQLAHDFEIPMQIVPKARLDRITRKNHQGVIAMASIVEYQSVEALVQFAYDHGDTPVVVMLDGVTDVRNIGAIARSAEVFGVTCLVIPTRGSAPLNADAMKTSAGALRLLNVSRVASMYETCRKMQESGLRICVADHQSDTPLDAVDFSGPAAIVMGSEDKGVHPRIGQLADVRFAIPQVGKTDSLNVSVATGVILYEVIRQRKTM